MLPHPAWITRLKASELHKVAVKIGTPCSGTKAVRLDGIRNVLTSVPTIESHGTSRTAGSSNEISVISIDMGIRNLAYSHWTASLARSTTKGLLQYNLPVLQTWRKIEISSRTPPSTQVGSGETERLKEAAEITCAKESFEPLDYADRAYELIGAMLDEHNPSHVLIERQRFRSGGNSAVQEWTIRVGVFEGMLYAVLRSLAAERKQYHNLKVEPVLPARVNRYWLEDNSLHDTSPGKVSVSRKGREIKEAKIELVRDLLRAISTKSQNRMFEVNDDVTSLISAFLPEGKRTGEQASPGGRKAQLIRQKTFKLSKLDDLSDCLLQGLAWFHWQNNRLRLGSADYEILLH